MQIKLHMALLDNVEMRRDGVPVAGFRAAKAQALLCCLAVTGRSHTRPWPGCCGAICPRPGHCRAPWPEVGLRRIKVSIDRSPRRVPIAPKTCLTRPPG
jgi:hypothetical protein